MKTEIVDHSPTRKELKIEIGADEVRAEFDRVSRQFAAGANVPGFRRGHAPVSVVRSRYKNEIRGEVVQNLVPRAVQNALVESGLNVLGEPEIHLDPDSGLDKLGESPLAVHAHVEVLPDVQLGQYRGIEVGRRVRPVTDETVDRMLEDLREQSASLEPVEDRGAQDGDTVTVNFVGKYIEPASDEDIKADEVDVVLGGEGVLQDFTDQLTGAREGDAKTFRVKYPEDFSSKGLAGKEIEYTATVLSVRRKHLPEMDDEWAKSFGEEGIETLDALRARLREQLEERARAESDHRVRDDLIRKLTGAHRFELPESLVEYQSRRLLETTVRDMMQRGVDPRQSGFNWEGMQGIFRSRAEEDLRGSMLLERIADAENIEPTDEEISQEIESIAAASRQTPEQVKAALTKQGGERSIADRLRHRKALDLLVDNAKITDEEWREDAPPAPQEIEATSETSQSNEATNAETASGS
ncbi:MAG: trigger factor [Acidobacteriota bacterium]|nr:trigger factor [Acidobacteriota bacterium]